MAERAAALRLGPRHSECGAPSQCGSDSWPPRRKAIAARRSGCATCSGTSVNSDISRLGTRPPGGHRSARARQRSAGTGRSCASRSGRICRSARPARSRCKTTSHCHRSRTGATAPEARRLGWVAQRAQAHRKRVRASSPRRGEGGECQVLEVQQRQLLRLQKQPQLAVQRPQAPLRLELQPAATVVLLRHSGELELHERASTSSTGGSRALRRGTSTGSALRRDTHRTATADPSRTQTAAARTRASGSGTQIKAAYQAQPPSPLTKLVQRALLLRLLQLPLKPQRVPTWLVPQREVQPRMPHINRSRAARSGRRDRSVLSACTGSRRTASCHC